MPLSLEVIDVEAYKMAFSSTYFSKLFPISQKHIDIWRRMQSRMVEALPRQLIFPSPLHNLSLTVKSSTGSVASRRNKRFVSGGLVCSANDMEANNNGFEINKNSNDNSMQESPTTIIGKKKCRESVYKHEDKEFCAADKCLRPYSKFSLFN